MRKKILKKQTLFYFLLFIPIVSFSQMWDYEKEDVEKMLWTDNSYIDKNNIPSVWNNSSAIILNKYVIHEIKKMHPSFASQVSIYHYRVRIQDQAALENYSELFFDKFESTFTSTQQFSNITVRNAQNDFYGFRIIKPNGEIHLINAEEEFIEEKIDDENKRKIAIPNLEIGDIFDYYIYTYAKVSLGALKRYVSNFHFINDQAILQDKYPIVNLKYEIITDKHFKVQLKSINCPEVIESEANEEYKFTLKSQNLDPIEESLWDFKKRTRSQLKISIQWVTDYIEKLKKDDTKYNSIRKVDNISLKSSLKNYYENENKEIYKDFKSYLSKNKLKDVTNEMKVEEYFYFLRHYFINMHLVYDAYNSKGNRIIYRHRFNRHIIYMLKKLNIEYEYLIAVPRKDGDISNIFSIRETMPILKINFDTPAYIYFDGKYSRYNFIPESLEGAYCLGIKKSTKKKEYDYFNFQLPASNAENNLLSSALQVQFNGQSLNIAGQISVKGQRMPYYQENYISIFDFVFDENIKYRTRRWGDTTQVKSKKMRNEIIQMHKDDKINFRKNFKEYLTNYYEIEEIELQSAVKKKIGIEPGESEFLIEYKANSTDFVNKVGNNFTVKIGKLTGEQIQIKEDELQRKYDVYIPYAGGEVHKISFKIPENYELKGIDVLNKTIENEFGSFESKTSLKQNTLLLEYNYIINTNFVKAENWSKLVEILNAAFEIQQKEILIKKLQK